MTRDQAVSLIRHSEFVHSARELEPMLSSSVKLIGKGTDSDSVEGGRSRLFGRPDLPADIDWPRFTGQPMAFAAELAAADFPSDGPFAALPKTGYLWFFYLWPEEYSDHGKDNWRLIYRDCPVDALDRRDPPSDIAEHNRGQHAFPIKFLEEYTLPDCEIAVEAGVPLQDAKDWKDYHALRESLSNPEGIRKVRRFHEFWWFFSRSYRQTFLQPKAEGRMFGHPFSVQSDPRLEASLQSGGQMPALDALSEWCLLLEINMDLDVDHAGWVGHDAGSVYWVIRRTDLEKGKFDSCVFIIDQY